MSEDVLSIERLREDPATEIPRVCNITDMTWEGVDRALQTTPGLLAFANVYFRQTRTAAAAAEYRYKEEATRAFARFRAEGVAIGEAKETAEIDEDVIRLKNEYLELDGRASLWYALLKGLESRMDALQQISSRQKMEASKNWRYNDPPENPQE